MNLKNRARWLRRLRLRFAVWAAVLLFLLGLGFLNGGCVSGMFYYPDREIYRKPSELPMPVEQVFFDSLDGTRLHGWFLSAEEPPRGTVIHFHGNAQNLTSHVSMSRWLTRHGLNVFIFDYRGYGQSDGRENRAGLVKDGAAAMRYVRGRPDVDPDRLIVLGQSLGAAVATAVLGEHGTDGVRGYIIDSSFYSYVSIVKDKAADYAMPRFLRGLVAPMLISNAHSPHRYYETLSGFPKLIIHGTADEVIPFRHGQDIFEALPGPRESMWIEGGRHIDAMRRGDGEEKARILAFLEDALR